MPNEVHWLDYGSRLKVSEDERDVWRDQLLRTPVAAYGRGSIYIDELVHGSLLFMAFEEENNPNTKEKYIELLECIVRRSASISVSNTAHGWTTKWVNSAPCIGEDERAKITCKLISDARIPIKFMMKEDSLALSTLLVNYQGPYLFVADCLINRIAHTSIPNDDAVPAITINGITGYNCLNCNTFCSWVEPNHPNGYVCSSCRG